MRRFYGALAALALAYCGVPALPASGQMRSASSVRPLPDCYSGSVTPAVDLNASSLHDSYPWLSQQLQEEGDTEIAFTVNANGRVSNVVLVRSSGSATLDDRAMSGAKQLIYTPAKSGGIAIACRNDMIIKWRLDSAPERYPAAPKYLVYLDTAFQVIATVQMIFILLLSW